MDCAIKVNKTTPENSRKRIIQKVNHKRFTEKQKRYSAKCLPTYPTCMHTDGIMKCRTLSMADIQKFHAMFYAEKCKIRQDTLIFKYCMESKPARMRIRDGSRKNKERSIRYYVLNLKNNTVRVCRNAFLGILNITKDRVRRIFKNFKGEVPRERRGGDRVGTKNNNKKRLY